MAEHGESGKSFSVCEEFTGAPPGMAGRAKTIAAWHFRIVGETVAFGEGKIAKADMNVRVDYEAALPLARRAYTPEMLAHTERNRPEAEYDSAGDRASLPAIDDRANLPAYLIELHNRMAVVTNPVRPRNGTTYDCPAPSPERRHRLRCNR